MLDIEAIKKLIPHRYPFLLVDRITEITPERIVGLKNVSANEELFAGHFPGRPIFPGVLIIEAMAQVGGAGMMYERQGQKAEGDAEDKHIIFMSIDKVKFRQMVVPGDQIRLVITPLKRKKKLCKMRGEAFVGETLVAEAEFIAALG